jgi:hypothetical protein
MESGALARLRFFYTFAALPRRSSYLFPAAAPPSYGRRILRFSSLVTQRRHRVNTCRPARRDITSNRRNRNQNQH